MLVLSLSGPLGAANPDVLKLQQALKDFAVAAKYASADPGAVDGFMGKKTLSALVSIAPGIPKIPSAVKTVLTYAPMILTAAESFLGDQTKVVYDTVASYAVDITNAINAYTMLYRASPPAGPSAPGQLQPPAALTNLAPGLGPSKYGPKAYYRYHKGKGVYIVYEPLAGVRLGATDPMVADPDNPTAKKVDVTSEPPPGVKAGEDVDDPLYKKWWFWTAIGGGALAIGVTTYSFTRRS
jgi:hypothetical protein